jgi:hypothetical protein
VCNGGQAETVCHHVLCINCMAELGLVVPVWSLAIAGASHNSGTADSVVLAAKCATAPLLGSSGVANHLR